MSAVFRFRASQGERPGQLLDRFDRTRYSAAVICGGWVKVGIRSDQIGTSDVTKQQSPKYTGLLRRVAPEEQSIVSCHERDFLEGHKRVEQRRNGSFEGEQREGQREREKKKKKLGSADRMISLPTATTKRYDQQCTSPVPVNVAQGAASTRWSPRYPNLIVKLEARLVLLQLISSLAVPKQS